jgi:hypothetical protein
MAAVYPANYMKKNFFLPSSFPSSFSNIYLNFTFTHIGTYTYIQYLLSPIYIFIDMLLFFFLLFFSST